MAQQQGQSSSVAESPNSCCAAGPSAGSPAIPGCPPDWNQLSAGEKWEFVETHLIKERGFTIRVWDGNGARMASRHRLNMRRQDSVVRCYAQGIVNDGLVAIMRGSPIATEGNHPGYYLMIGGGTFFEAIYVACEISPENKHIEAIRNKGVPNCIILKVDTPDAIVSWLVDEHNNHHTGSGKTFVEWYSV